MKKVITVEIRKGSLGIPKNEPFTFGGDGQKTLMQYLYEDFMEMDRTEDIDYIEITNEIKLIAE